MPAAEPFPGIGFQITIQESPTDDLPCYEQEQTGLECRLHRAKKQEKVSIYPRNPRSKMRRISF
jgi:hypothetical protein